MQKIPTIFQSGVKTLDTMSHKIVLLEEEKEIILEGIANGISFGVLAKQLGVSRRTIVRICATDPRFESEVAHSRAIFADSLVESLLTVGDNAQSMAEVQNARLKADSIRWIASKYAPKMYADNINVNVQHHLDLSSVLLAAENRVLPLLIDETSSIANAPHEISEVSATSEADADHVDSFDDLI